MSRKFLRLHAVLDKTGCTRSWVYDQIKQGLFPKQITIGDRAVGWLEEEVEGWMEKCITASRTDGGRDAT